MVEDSRKLFVAGLPDTITEDVLRQLFEATGGNVVEVSLPRDKATSRPRGFGFVSLATSEEANAARESLDGSFLAGRSISVRPWQADPPKREAGAPPRSSGPRDGGGGGGMGGGGAAPDRTLYVGNLPYDATQEEVEGLIAATGAGPIARIHLPTDPEGRKRGFGFVTMASADAAKGAIEGLRTANIRGRRLVVNLAHPKGERPGGPPSSGRFEGGGGGGFGGGGGGGYGGPPPSSGFGGPPPSGGFGGPPAGGYPSGAAPSRRGHDDRRRHTDDGPPRTGGGGGGGGRRDKRDWRRGTDDDDDG
jgi:nucleolin